MSLVVYFVQNCEKKLCLFGGVREKPRGFASLGVATVRCCEQVN